LLLAAFISSTTHGYAQIHWVIPIYFWYGQSKKKIDIGNFGLGFEFE
jgi:hypothetical protein